MQSWRIHVLRTNEVNWAIMYYEPDYMIIDGTLIDRLLYKVWYAEYGALFHFSVCTIIRHLLDNFTQKLNK